MTQATNIDATVVAMREETDASLAEERDKTDVQFGQAAPATGSVDNLAAREAVSAERAETDESLLAERNEVDQVVDETKALLVQEHREAGASRAAIARRDEFLVRGEPSARTAPEKPLSAREREVVQLIAEGKSSKEIAAILQIAVPTVDTYRRQIMEKLNLRTIAELTKYAIREGLTSADR